MKFGDIHCWIFGSLACDISINVDDEVKAGSETLGFIHANPEHVLAERPDKDWNVEGPADSSRHTNIGKATFLWCVRYTALYTGQRQYQFPI